MPTWPKRERIKHQPGRTTTSKSVQPPRWTARREPHTFAFTLEDADLADGRLDPGGVALEVGQVRPEAVELHGEERLVDRDVRQARGQRSQALDRVERRVRPSERVRIDRTIGRAVIRRSGHCGTHAVHLLRKASRAR